MSWDFAKTKRGDGGTLVLVASYSSSASPLPSLGTYQKDPSPPSPASNGSNKINPAILFIIVVLAVVFFISGLLHLVFRFLIKHPSPSSHSSRYPAEIHRSEATTIQRQLQQLFHLHDSGLDQALIDSLPVFLYREIVGPKEPFDCAVCLCEFSEQDKLRFLPLCGHAFHISCIDTWLLSNSTCPLCRGTLYGSSMLAIENPVFEFDDERDDDGGASGNGEDGNSSGQKVEESGGIEKRVFSVRLGKFRGLNGGGDGEANGETSTSSINLDGRRCYSMGSYQYVVGDSNLQIALCGQRFPNDDEYHCGGRKQQRRQQIKRGCDGGCSNPPIQTDLEGKKLCGRSGGESFSVSKIWLWPKKEKSTSSFNVNAGRSAQDS